jgi:hypothetical protein
MYEYILNKLKKYDMQWCKYMDYDNTYITAFEYPLSYNLEPYDLGAYKRFPEHNFVYDKLWIAKSQNLACGRLENITIDSKINYPIFIKPRWGHKTSSSRNCFKINSFNEIEKHQSKKDIIWSEYIDGTERMTDFMLIQGQIVYQITYQYSKDQHGYIDSWKYISPKNKCPTVIYTWVEKHMRGYTGALNVQYRDYRIIEVSLRLARGGSYIQSTQNKNLIQNVNNVVDKGLWDYNLDENNAFEPFYSFKCYTTSPLYYILPYKITQNILKKMDCMPFFEYYFEPSGNEGMVFLQFNHTNFTKGMQCKKIFENLVSYINYIFIITIFLCLIMIAFDYKQYLAIILLIIIFVVYLTRFLNPIDVQYKLMKVKKQNNSSNINHFS